MTKRISSKFKIDRRFGVNLWGRSKSPVAGKRNYGPGQHGQRRKKPTDFGTQLAAKQKLKGYYGNITERQFRNYYIEASRERGDTGERLVQLLERRLDAVVYRLKFALTVFASRQMVNHGHIKVNGKRVTFPSFLVSEGDTIELNPRLRENQIVMEAVVSTERDVPDYFEVDHEKLRGKMTRYPAFADVPYPVRMEPNLVVEYYSR